MDLVRHGARAHSCRLGCRRCGPILREDRVDCLGRRIGPTSASRLATLKPGEPAKAVDLWDYSQDLRYTEIQRGLFTYLLPVCLQAWHDDLRGVRDYGGFVEHFYPVLADRHVFDTHLTSEQTAAVSEFMRKSILAEIDDQRGLTYSGMNARPYRWTGALTTYGVLLPDVDRLCTAWWAISTMGRAETRTGARDRSANVG